MNSKVPRFLIAAGTALFLVFSAWTTVSAAKATSRFLVGALIGNSATSSVTETAVATETPMVASTPQATGDDHNVAVTPGIGTPQVGEKEDQDNDQEDIAANGNSEMDENDSEEHDSHPAMTGTTQPGKGSDEHHNNSNGGSGSGGDNNDGGDD